MGASPFGRTRSGASSIGWEGTSRGTEGKGCRCYGGEATRKGTPLIGGEVYGEANGSIRERGVVWRLNFQVEGDGRYSGGICR